MNSDYLKKLIKEISKIMNENKEYLIELDSVVGDGDLGLTMSDGFKAAYDAIYESNEKDCGKILYSAVLLCLSIVYLLVFYSQKMNIKIKA